MNATKCWTTGVLAGLVIVAVCIMATCGGCAQNTETPVDQESRQQVTTPSETEQQQAAQGNQYYFYVVNGPGKNEIPYPGAGLNIGGGDVTTNTAKIIGSSASSAAGAAGETTAGYAQSGVSITVNTGSTSPSLAGTTTGTTSGVSQTPTQNPSVNPNQEPKASVSIPVGVAMPGGSNTQQAEAVGEGSASGMTQTATTELKTQLNQLQTTVDKMGEAIKAISDSLETLLGTSSQPAEGD